MRTLSVTVLAATIVAGTAYRAGRTPSVDMVPRSYSDDLPNPTHLGHWATVTAGRTLFLTANAMEPGVGEGDAIFGVLVVGQGVVCELRIPCTTVSGDFLEMNCPAHSISPGEQIHLEFSHNCTTSPRGNLVAGFEWRP